MRRGSTQAEHLRAKRIEGKRMLTGKEDEEDGALNAGSNRAHETADARR